MLMSCDLERKDFRPQNFSVATGGEIEGLVKFQNQWWHHQIKKRTHFLIFKGKFIWSSNHV